MTEWEAYASLEPFGSRAEMERDGQICAVIANTAQRKKGSRVFAPKDFFSLDDSEASDWKESAASIWSKAAIITEAYRSARRE